MAAQLEIRAPAEQTEGTRSQILRWLKSPGEPVVENEPLIEIETDKVTVEIAAPASGTLREILKHAQDEIGPGELLGRLDTSGPAHADLAAAPTPPSADARLPASPALSRSVAAAQSSGRPLSPAVRRLLAERGLEAAQVQGSGPDGRITVEDVLATAEIPTAAAFLKQSDTPDAVEAGSRSTLGPKRIIPHTATRRRIAEHMVQSLLHTAPHVTTVFEADLAAVLAHRQRHKDEFEQRGAPLTLTAYFLQAAVAAIRAVPEANSHWSDAALEVYESVHVGVATALPTGLVAPVLKDVQARDLFAIASGLHDLVVRARAGKLLPADMRDGTFTISNHGVSGSLLATPIIINQPQSAILGVGKLEKRPVVVSEGGEDRIVIRPRCYVTLTLDHRVMDGHQANHFLQVFVQSLTAQAD